MKDIKNLLIAWGNWARERIGTEYPSGWPLVQPSSDMRPMLSDSEAEIVDRAVRRLKAFDELGFDILVAHYCGNLSSRVIGRAICLSHASVAGYLSRSESYIAGVIGSSLDAA